MCIKNYCSIKVKKSQFINFLFFFLFLPFILLISKHIKAIAGLKKKRIKNNKMINGSYSGKDSIIFSRYIEDKNKILIRKK